MPIFRSTVNKTTQRMSIAVDGSDPLRLAGLDRRRATTRRTALSGRSAWKPITSPRSGTTRRCRIRCSSPRSATPSTGPTEQRNLGRPVSHGCVRLSVKNAATLWELVKRQKMANTTVVLSGGDTGRREATRRGALSTDASDRR